MNHCNVRVGKKAGSTLEGLDRRQLPVRAGGAALGDEVAALGDEGRE